MLLSHVLAVGCLCGAAARPKPYDLSCAASRIGSSGFVSHSRSPPASPICSPSKPIPQEPSPNSSRPRSWTYSAAYSDLWIGLISLLAAAIIAIVLLRRQTHRSCPPKIAARFHFAGNHSCPRSSAACRSSSSSSSCILTARIFSRYGIPSIFGVAILVPWFVARWTRNSSCRRAHLLHRLLSSASSPPHRLPVTCRTLSSRPAAGCKPYRKIRHPHQSGHPDLALRRRQRTYLPRDESAARTVPSFPASTTSTMPHAAVQYANATIFEGFPVLKGKFPIRGQHHAVSAIHSSALEVSCSGHLQLS